MFHRLRLIESYGAGIRKIYHLYQDCANQPRIEVTPNAFKIILPNFNAAGAAEDAAQKVTPQMQALLNVKRTRVYTLTKQLQEAGLITASGRGADKKFRLP